MILLTGGTGFVGRHLLAALLARGEAVRVFTRTASALGQREGMEVAEGDLADPLAVERAMEGARVVVHLAARVAHPSDQPDALYEFNVRSTAVLAAAARRAGVSRFVHLSSAGVYGDGRRGTRHSERDAPRPGNAYERSKLAAEHALAAALDGGKARLTILRPTGIYGPGRPVTRAWLGEVRHRALWMHANPRVIVHPTHVDDVVQACLRLLASPRVDERVINIGGERALPYQDLVALAAELLGARARQVVLPGAVGRPLARGASRILRAARLPVPATIERAGHDWVNRAVDTALARRVLDFEPVPLRQGLRATIAGP